MTIDPSCQNPCKVPPLPDVNLDAPPPYCGRDDDPNKRAVNTADLNWLKDSTFQKTGFGAAALCDPMQTGSIFNDVTDPELTTIYRYSNSLRGADEAMKDLFSNVVIFDINKKPHKVPIIWGTQEDAVAAIILDNVRDDNTLVVDKIRLPMMAIVCTDMQPANNRYVYHKAFDYMRYRRPDNKPGFTLDENGRGDRSTVFGIARGRPVDRTYTLWVWTTHENDMRQLEEQIYLKFSQTAYIRVAGVQWEIPVILNSQNITTNFQPEDKEMRVVKAEFNMTIETYIPQPIHRTKAVLSTQIEFVDGMTDEETTTVMSRLEEIVKELEC